MTDAEGDVRRRVGEVQVGEEVPKRSSGELRGFYPVSSCPPVLRVLLMIGAVGIYHSVSTLVGSPSSSA